MYRDAKALLVAPLALVIVSCGDGSSGSSDDTPATISVNTYRDDAQSLPQVALLDDDRIVIAWNSVGQDGDSTGVFARVYSSDLVAATADEFQVNVATTGSQTLRGVAPLDSGGFLVTWRDGSLAFGRRFDGSGAPAGEPFEVTGGLGDAFAVDGLGRFVVGEEASCDGDYGESFDCVAVRRTPQDATSAGESFFTTPVIYDLYFQPMTPWASAIAASTGGDFVVAWGFSGEHHENQYHHHYLQAFDADVSPRGETSFIGSSGPLRSQPLATMNEAGSFVVAWDWCASQYDDWGYSDGSCYRSGIEGIRAASGNDPDRRFFTVTDNQSDYGTGDRDHFESAAINEPGQFVVVWQRSPGNRDDGDLFAQRFDEQADVLGDSFMVNENIRDVECCARSLMLADATVLVVWQGDDGDDSGIFARAFPVASP
jgi:hypothetical protein